jgi:hypothetical protein
MPIRLMMVIAALIICSACAIKPVVLACDGEMRTLGIAGIGERPEKYSVSPGSNLGVSTGTLNRITGAVSIHILPFGGGLLGFDGICKPAKALF